MILRALKDAGRYRMVKCGWCDGEKCMDHRMVELFVRWRRIRARNIASGRCMPDHRSGPL